MVPVHWTVRFGILDDQFGSQLMVTQLVGDKLEMLEADLRY